MRKLVLLVCLLFTACRTGTVVSESDLNKDIVALKNTEIQPTWSAQDMVLNDIAQSVTLSSVTGEWYGSDIIYTYGVSINLKEGCSASAGDGSFFTITCGQILYKVNGENPLNLIDMGEPWYGENKRVGSIIYSISPTK